MIFLVTMKVRPCLTLLFSLVSALVTVQSVSAQSAVDAKNWTAAEDHQNMMDQLGIKALRPGPSGNEAAANHANYDAATANPFPNLPDVLTLKNGKKVTKAAVWWNQRRPEIVEDFEREVLGRIPKNVPKVTWEVTKTVEAKVGNHPVVGKQLLGHVDNSSAPRHTGRYPDDAGGPGRREGARAGDDDVRRAHHTRGRISGACFPRARRGSGTRRAHPGGGPARLLRTPTCRRPNN